jgi:hypothetical protein
MRRSSILLAAGAMAGMLCGACADSTIDIAGATLTSGAIMSQGKRTPVAQFTHDDYVVMLVDFTWQDAANDGGNHKFYFDWYRDGRLVSKSPTKFVHFVATPVTLRTDISAALLGTGHFRVDAIVDDKLVAHSEFDIGT